MDVFGIGIRIVSMHPLQKQERILEKKFKSNVKRDLEIQEKNKKYRLAICDYLGM